MRAFGPVPTSQLRRTKPSTREQAWTESRAYGPTAIGCAPWRGMTKQAAYDSDISDEEWSYLEPLLPAPKCGTSRVAARRSAGDRNGLRYVLRSGCAWRLLPHDLPPWWTVYHYLRTWKQDGTWVPIQDELRGDVRQSEGRDLIPSRRSSTHGDTSNGAPGVGSIAGFSSRSNFARHLSRLPWMRAPAISRAAPS